MRNWVCPGRGGSWNTVLCVKIRNIPGKQRQVGHPTNVYLTIHQAEEDALKLQAEATARALGEMAQGQQVLRESMQQLEVQLRGAWLGHAHQEFEALKVSSSQPWKSQDPDS